MLFLFFQNFDFSGCCDAKRAKNGKRFCLSQAVFQEPYLIWLWFLVHMCKMMISPCSFFIFSKFWFFGFTEWIKGQKMTHNYQFQSAALYIAKAVEHVKTKYLVQRCKIVVSPGVFVYFLKSCNINIKILTFFIDPF